MIPESKNEISQVHIFSQLANEYFLSIFVQETTAKEVVMLSLREFGVTESSRWVYRVLKETVFLLLKLAMKPKNGIMKKQRSNLD